MANQWIAYIQINGEETSDYYISNFEVTDLQYDSLTDAVNNNIPVKSLDFYSELVKLAEATIDWEELYLDEDWKPCEEDFYVPREELEEIPEELEDDESYCKELVFDQRAYEEELALWKSFDKYCIAAIDIYDPGDLERFKRQFVGRELEDNKVFDIDEMYEYAASLDGDVSGLYIDMEFKERVQLENAIRSVGDNDTLVVKNYLHLKRFTGASFAVFKDIEDNGGKIISQEEGRIKSVDKDMIQELRDSSINVAYYDGQLHKYDKDNAELDLQKVKAYIRCCTNGWKLTNDDIYIDEYGFSKQRRLEELIENQDRYGLIIVNSYPRLNKDISRFMKIVKRIHIPIYSMREEF